MSRYTSLPTLYLFPSVLQHTFLHHNGTEGLEPFLGPEAG